MNEQPIGVRAGLPDRYGLAANSGVLDWSEVDARIAESEQYWICTVDSDGVPFPRPIDGVWMNMKVHVSGDPKSRWKRNLNNNPTASMHLPDGAQAVILHGSVSIEQPDLEFAERIAATSNAKYGYGLPAQMFRDLGVVIFSPSTIIAWNTLYKDATRFVIDS